ncbi:phosphoribosyltransferase [Thiomicrorhabdus sp.]|uniref:phosphoribosyltransferase n=1 Tax=Thiomicrorhabdus sp. TaxID=2039724 RepID=UPI003562DF85
MQTPIPNRTVAGKELADEMRDLFRRENLIVLALPRGGVPVAYEIARKLNAPLDLLLVRKLGTPGFPELAMGAIASGGIRVLNSQVIRSYAISEADIEAVEVRERQELQRREQAYRGQRPHPDLSGKNVILVDDGLATGSTMHAAIDAVRQQNPQTVTVAVPVAPPDTIYELRQKVDEVICPVQPHYFSSIGQWYDDFSQVSDEEVTSLLLQAWQS